jgi:hypothetical protein
MILFNCPGRGLHQAQGSLPPKVEISMYLCFGGVFEKMGDYASVSIASAGFAAISAARQPGTLQSSRFFYARPILLLDLPGQYKVQ